MWARRSLRAALGASAAGVWVSAGSLCAAQSAPSSSTRPLPPSPPSPSLPSRLRRFETSRTRYEAGQSVELLYVPQIVKGVDLGHVTLQVQGATLAFYGKNYRSGLSFVRHDEGVIVTPCPLHARAVADDALRTRIETLYRGTLSQAQADALNQWAHRLEISLIREQERGVASIPGVYYQAFALSSDCENCATFLMNHFLSEDSVRCPRGMPRLCRAAV